MKFDIHFCLVSDQAAANLLPILDNNFKPKEAIFLVSKSREKKAEYLKSAFKDKGITVIIEYLENEFNLDLLEKNFLTIIEKYKEKNIALNATGGTKLMSIIGVKIFDAIKKPIFYLNTSNNEIIFVSKENNQYRSEKLQTRNDLEIYFSSYGFKINRSTSKEKVQINIPEIECFIQEYKKYKELIPKLNSYASKVKNNKKENKYKVKINEQDEKINDIEKLLVKLNKNNLIEYNQDKIINFKNDQIISFIKGGWLELYIYDKTKSLLNSDNIEEIEKIIDCNITIKYPEYNKDEEEDHSDNLGKKNEFDIVFITKNCLHIIECKTGKIKGDTADKILYKLHALKNYGGLMTKTCLVTYSEVSQVVKNKADHLRIKIIQGNEINNLENELQKWIGLK
ncbi:uncharacterized protein DUF1887 [Bisgaardia hudsonensis]|uniref:Uncharacterized protein DUF1887 n=1 Tax=Bisgaardia hudsonensis TaxID=109472 RepID=A0A4R2N145_9PAST|nr:DUF1887 family CARF protein [Bisgaardia hudsonensis]TCP13234.1 uncharacterized protein DUF1887 [Bisgaardia hudsonensis]